MPVIVMLTKCKEKGTVSLVACVELMSASPTTSGEECPVLASRHWSDSDLWTLLSGHDTGEKVRALHLPRPGAGGHSGTPLSFLSLCLSDNDLHCRLGGRDRSAISTTCPGLKWVCLPPPWFCWTSCERFRRTSQLSTPSLPSLSTAGMQLIYKPFSSLLPPSSLQQWYW